MDTTKSLKGKVYRPKKSRKFTVILTVTFLFIGGLIGLGLLAPIASDMDSLDATSVVAFGDFIYEKDELLFLWRLSIYAILIGIFYVWSRKRMASTSKKLVKASTVRIALYLIIFELIIVQNSLSKLFSLIA
jgi:hypothetical protein